MRKISSWKSIIILISLPIILSPLLFMCSMWSPRTNSYSSKCPHHLHPPSSLSDFQLSQMIYNDHHRVLYCSIPKVASSNWKRIFLLLKLGDTKGELDPDEIPSRVANSASLPTLRTLNEDEREYRLRNYYKFMFVRDPMDRLISAYRSKFTYNNTIYEHLYGDRIRNKYRGDGSHHPVTFIEFLTYLTDPEEELISALGSTGLSETSVNNTEGIQQHLNQHWAPYWLLCAPCTVQYNLIGRLETLTSDAQTVLQATGLNHGVAWRGFPSRNKFYKNQPAGELKSDFLQSVPPEILERVYQLYKLDYGMFNYNPP